LKIKCSKEIPKCNGGGGEDQLPITTKGEVGKKKKITGRVEMPIEWVVLTVHTPPAQRCKIVFGDWRKKYSGLGMTLEARKQKRTGGKTWFEDRAERALSDFNSQWPSRN